MPSTEKLEDSIAMCLQPPFRASSKLAVRMRRWTSAMHRQGPESDDDNVRAS